MLNQRRCVCKVPRDWCRIESIEDWHACENEASVERNGDEWILFNCRAKTDEDGIVYPDYSHSIVELGNIVIEEGEYDDDFQQIKAPVLSDKYHVDVLWKKSEITQTDKDGVKSIKYPTGWVSKEIDFDNGEGVHTFLGVSYQANKWT